jgi:hypothetical protein
VSALVAGDFRFIDGKRHSVTHRACLMTSHTLVVVNEPVTLDPPAPTLRPLDLCQNSLGGTLKIASTKTRGSCGATANSTPRSRLHRLPINLVTPI